MCDVFCGNEMDVRGKDCPLADILRRHKLGLYFQLSFLGAGFHGLVFHA